MHIDHVGIAVNDLDMAIKTYETLLDTVCYKRETVTSQKVEAAFFQTGTTKVELLEATEAGPGSVIGRFLERRGEGVHHVAFRVEDIHGEMRRLRDNGFTLLSDEPVVGADNKLVAFVHPESNHGVLIELCEEMDR